MGPWQLEHDIGKRGLNCRDVKENDESHVCTLRNDFRVDRDGLISHPGESGTHVSVEEKESLLRFTRI